MTFIVDTNVILVANGQHDDVGPPCVAACALKLQAIMTNGRIALDHDFEILLEYQNKTTPKMGNRPGDAFVKWALQNNANETKCDRIELHYYPDRGYKSFPDDERLSKFDPPDRKFVASQPLTRIIRQFSKPPIPNGWDGHLRFQITGSKWISSVPATFSGSMIRRRENEWFLPVPPHSPPRLARRGQPT